jgi:hypothetical protein
MFRGVQDFWGRFSVVCQQPSLLGWSDIAIDHATFQTRPRQKAYLVQGSYRLEEILSFAKTLVQRLVRSAQLHHPVKRFPILWGKLGPKVIQNAMNASLDPRSKSGLLRRQVLWKTDETLLEKVYTEVVRNRECQGHVAAKDSDEPHKVFHRTRH